MSEGKASLWLSLAMVFAGLVASWVTLREQTANHERHITEIRANVADMQRDNRLSDRMRSVEISIAQLTEQVSAMREEIREIKRHQRRER